MDTLSGSNALWPIHLKDWAGHGAPCFTPPHGSHNLALFSETTGFRYLSLTIVFVRKHQIQNANAKKRLSANIQCQTDLTVASKLIQIYKPRNNSHEISLVLRNNPCRFC